MLLDPKDRRDLIRIVGAWLGAIVGAWLLVNVADIAGAWTTIKVEDRFQALASVFGAALGAFGAYLAARWSFDREAREAYGRDTDLARAFADAIEARAVTYTSLASDFGRYGSAAAFANILGIPEIRLAMVVEMSDGARSAIAARFPAWDMRLSEFDRMLKHASELFVNFRPTSQANANLYTPTNLAVNLKIIAESSALLRNAGMALEEILVGVERRVAGHGNQPAVFHQIALVRNSIDVFTAMWRDAERELQAVRDHLAASKRST